MQKAKLEKYREVLSERLVLAAGLAQLEARRARLMRRDHALLGDIRDALDRIESGSFGVCASCGHELSERRLAIRPAARRCVDCERPGK